MKNQDKNPFETWFSYSGITRKKKNLDKLWSTVSPRMERKTHRGKICGFAKLYLESLSFTKITEEMVPVSRAMGD